MKILPLVEKNPVQWSKAEVDDIEWTVLKDGQILDIEIEQRFYSSLRVRLPQKLSRISSDFENKEFVLTLFRFCIQKKDFKSHQFAAGPNVHTVVKTIAERTENLVLKMVSQSLQVLRFLPEIKTIFKVVLAAVQTDGRVLEFAS